MKRFLSTLLAGWLVCAAPALAAPKVVCLTSGTTWTVPRDFSGRNTIEAIGAGGNGTNTGSGGGRGGDYAKISNYNQVTPGGSVSIQVGTGDTCFVSCTVLKASAAAGGGDVGAVTFLGGTPNAAGGGAAGPHGAGANGASSVGGQGDNGFGGAGGTGNAGKPGQEFTCTGGTLAAGTKVGSGGGGGAITAPGVAPGGLYGGAGGQTSSGTNAGAQGLIVITYTPNNVSTSVF